MRLHPNAQCKCTDRVGDCVRLLASIINLQKKMISYVFVDQQRSYLIHRVSYQHLLQFWTIVVLLL